jgi:hypothetical protein
MRISAIDVDGCRPTTINHGKVNRKEIEFNVADLHGFAKNENVVDEYRNNCALFE